MSKIEGTDSAGNHWVGIRTGDHIKWTSSKGLSGTEQVRDNGDGTFTGISATGDVVPCHYNGKSWSGNCPSADYKET